MIVPKGKSISVASKVPSKIFSITSPLFGYFFLKLSGSERYSFTEIAKSSDKGLLIAFLSPFLTFLMKSF